MVALVGSVPTGRAVMRAASDTVKPVMLELGGKNALIAFADADPDEVAGAVIAGMNFTWCGQSCGSTSRAFIHEKLYDAVLARVKEKIKAFRPGIPTDPATTMGAIVSKVQFDRVIDHIASGKEERRARLLLRRRTADAIRRRWRSDFGVEPTVPFADVDMTMRIAREEIFGPGARASLNGRTRARCSRKSETWSNTASPARSGPMTSRSRIAPRRRVEEAGFVWNNEVGQAFPHACRSAAVANPASGAARKCS